MEYSIRKIGVQLTVNEVKLEGYSFRDKLGRCIIIVYGERGRDIMVKRFATYK